jgi:hypothetical protein
MRYVLDQNMTRDNKIENYLRDGNEIILLHDFIAEPFKSPNYETILENNLKILRNYPQRIFITFERGKLLQKEWDTGHPIKKDDIVDPETSETFRNYLRNTVPYSNVLKQNAEKRINEQEYFAENFIKNVAIQYFTEAEEMIHIYKNDRNKKINEIKELVFKLLKYTFDKKYVTNDNIRFFEENISMNFCQSFILVWRIVDWVIKKGARNAKKAIRGDGFDIKHVVYSCFCDGIFTCEKWMEESRKDLLALFTTFRF